MYLNRAVYKADNPAGPYDFNNDDLMKVVEYADAGDGRRLCFRG